MDVPPNLPSANLSAPTPGFFSPLNSLRDARENSARIFCLVFGLVCLVGTLSAGGIGFILIAIGFLIWVFSFFMAAHLKGRGVLVTDQSWPELNAIVEASKAKLGISGVKAYVVQDSTFNAFATRMAGAEFIVLNSGAIDTLLRKGQMNDLRFLVGHECGHVAMGHTGFVGGMLPQLAAFFLSPLHNWYRRCQERSADRCGLYCAGNRKDAHRSIAVLAGGSEAGSRLELPQVVAQWNEVRHETWIAIVRFFSDYPHTAERIILIHQAADELHIP